MPWVSLALTGLGLALCAVPSAPDVLEYRRGLVAAGEWWRPLSGQLVHWNLRMALTDLLVVGLLGCWCERRAPLATRVLLLTGPPVVGAAIHLALTGLEAYRGASSLASGLFVLVAARVSADSRRRWPRALAVVALALFAAKLLYETHTGAAFFAGDLPDGVVVTPRVHLVAAAHAAAVVGGLAAGRRLVKSAG